jgi:hypothetical protein
MGGKRRSGTGGLFSRMPISIEEAPAALVRNSRVLVTFDRG